MGFRKGAYATVWEVDSVNDVRTKARITISKKDKNGGGFTQEFSGYVSFLGTVAAQKALKLKPRDRIKLGDVDVSTNYVKEKKVTYTNYSVFSFEGPDDLSESSSLTSDPQPQVDSGEVDDRRVPF